MEIYQTPDGTSWGVTRAGRADGRPILLQHGLMGVGRFEQAWVQLADSLGFEWIAIDRPGYGGTPPMPMDRVADWPAMVAPLMDVLGIRGRFDVVGISAGAPYSYALAAAWPDRVVKVGILSGVPFVNVPEVMAAYSADEQRAYASYATQTHAETRKVFDEAFRNLPESARQNDDVLTAMAALDAYDFAGPVREARLQALDWGFDRSAIHRPVHIWHSKEDDMVPFEAARRSAEGLPGATFSIQVQPSHAPSHETAKDLLTWLSSE